MSGSKLALSLTALAAGLSLLALAPADARPACKTKVVKVVVKKVVCDCKAPARRAKTAVRTKAKVTHAAVRHVTARHVVVRHVAAQTWHETPYAGPPAGVVYVDQSTPPVYGGSRAVNATAVMMSSATYSRTVRITRGGFGGAPGCGPCGGRPADLTGVVDDGIYNGGVGYGGDTGYYGGGGYAVPVAGYGYASPVAFGFRASASASSHVSYHVGGHSHGGSHGGGRW